jgi:hypothetical protein
VELDRADDRAIWEDLASAARPIKASKFEQLAGHKLTGLVGIKTFSKHRTG